MLDNQTQFKAGSMVKSTAGSEVYVYRVIKPVTIVSQTFVKAGRGYKLKSRVKVPGYLCDLMINGKPCGKMELPADKLTV